MLVWLVSIDCLRYDYVNKLYTPFIFEFSRKAHNFSSCFAAGNATPYSFPAILASHYRFQQQSHEFDNEKPTVARILKSNGYTTIGIQAGNPFLTSYYNYNENFDEYTDFLDNIDKKKSIAEFDFWEKTKHSPLQRIIEYSKFILFNKYTGIDSNTVTKKTIARLKLLRRNEKIFLWTHFMDAHATFVPHRRFLHNYSALSYWWKIYRIKRLYDKKSFKNRDLEIAKEFYSACIVQVDDSISQIFKFLKTAQLYDDAIIIITSDHGESFMEHGYIGHPSINIYNEQIRVPLIIKLPQQCYGKIHSKNISHINLMPSLLQFLNIISQFPLHDHNNIFYDYTNKNPIFICGKKAKDYCKIACILGIWKLITEIRNKKVIPLELYNMRDDPYEKSNVLLMEKHIVMKLIKYISKCVNECFIQEKDNTDMPDKKIINRLKALGYL